VPLSKKSFETFDKKGGFLLKIFKNYAQSVFVIGVCPAVGGV
jgi:hypothetical protein